MIIASRMISSIADLNLKSHQLINRFSFYFVFNLFTFKDSLEQSFSLPFILFVFTIFTEPIFYQLYLRFKPEESLLHFYHLP